MPVAAFKGDKDTTYGFTDEDGNQVTREASADGTVTARNIFEERHFETVGLKRVEKAAARPRSSKRKSSSKKSSTSSSRPSATASEPAPAASTDEAADAAVKE